jgi:hypothetical protein
MLYKNEFGMMSFPIYLTVAVITASAILIIFTYSIFNLMQESQTDIVKKQIQRIINEAENMFEYADSGSKTTISVNFPDSMSFAVFGALPEKNIQEPFTFRLNENTSNNYYFVMQNKDIVTYSANARFCGESTEDFAILYKGEYTVFLELVLCGGKTYVKIY